MLEQLVSGCYLKSEHIWMGGDAFDAAMSCIAVSIEDHHRVLLGNHCAIDILKAQGSER